MKQSTLQVHPQDDVLVALRDHQPGEVVPCGAGSLSLVTAVAAKHKVAIRSVRQGEFVRMYGIIVGQATRDISAGEAITTGNVRHAVDTVRESRQSPWCPPDVQSLSERTFQGFVRADGRVGTRNHWLVVPLVFCQNRNLQVMAEALVGELGYRHPNPYTLLTRNLMSLRAAGASWQDLLAARLELQPGGAATQRPFPHVDGIKFLRHEGGCGGTYEDARNLCGLLAGYIHHPNVAGATVLSLGCQKSQVQTLREEIDRRGPLHDKPLYVFDQQRCGTEQQLLTTAIRHTLAGVAHADQARRQPVPIGKLAVGVECGGSDGFSGISANPAIGHCSDLVVAVGGIVILSEFPELAGCENDLTARCQRPELAERFLHIMREYDRRAVASGGGFDHNPSPGNIRDGLITDAIKSAGAARKGGTSPVVDVLDYPEMATRPGLNLLCTPGGDVESTTAKAAAGATVQLFSTGLGTPTGNPVSPVIKISSNTPLAQRMPDIIDLDAGGIVGGEKTIEAVGRRILDLVIEVASGTRTTAAEALGQDDFIPWKRGLSF